MLKNLRKGEIAFIEPTLIRLSNMHAKFSSSIAGCGEKICSYQGIKAIALTCIPASIVLSIREVLPDSVTPYYPTYLKFFVCQTLLFAVAFLIVCHLIKHRLDFRGGLRAGLSGNLFPIILVFYAGWAGFSYLWAPWEHGARAYLLREFTFLA
ncbi:MAG: hypothetical protein ACOC0A_02640, partial [Planctomycetota bacterium]